MKISSKVDEGARQDLKDSADETQLMTPKNMTPSPIATEQPD